MASIPYGRKKKHQRLSASADTEDPAVSTDRLSHLQNGHLTHVNLGATEVLSLAGNAIKKENSAKNAVEHDARFGHSEAGLRKERTPLVLRRLKQTEKHRKQETARRNRLSTSVKIENDEAGLQQLQKLRTAVERLGGKLEDGWHVNSQRRSNNGFPFFIFISPTKERFRSRIEVVRHLGLPARPTKSRLRPNTHLDLVPYERRNKSLIKSSKASGIPPKPNLKNHKSHGCEDKVADVLKSLKNSKDLQVTSSSSLTIASDMTQRCQDILRSIISTESFAALSNMLSQGASSPSMEATLQLKGLSFPASSLDLKLIHLRLSTGAYGQTPELFSTDIQQVWKNIITAGNELVSLASSLAELSESLFKQQIMSLFDGSPKKIASGSNTGNQQPFDDIYAHAALPEGILARVTEATVWKELPADVLFKDHMGVKSLPSAREATEVRMEKEFLLKKAATKARYQSSDQLDKRAGQAKELLASRGLLLCSSADKVCRKCGLSQGAECVVCNRCKAKYHLNCVTSMPTAGRWSCPLCFLNQATEKVRAWGTFNRGILEEETQEELLVVNSSATTEICHDLQDSARKTGICEACKKEDDNVLLCDACDAAYHMHCLSPCIESIPDGFWYCPACDEAGKKAIVYEQDSNVHNCAVCERVSRELLNCAENESTAQVFSKDTSPVYLAPQHSMDHGCPEQSLNQGVSEPCIEYNAMQQRRLDHGCPEQSLNQGVSEPQEDKSVEPDSVVETGITCKVCGLGEVKKIIFCSNCRNCYHWSCLKPAIRKRPRKIWYCPSCLCRVCKIDADDDKILLCDACDEGYHTYCLKPPISEIPEEAWYCQSCTEAKPDRTERPTKKQRSNELMLK